MPRRVSRCPRAGENLWDTVIAFPNPIVPLNGDGFRAEVIPLARIEAAF